MNIYIFLILKGWQNIKLKEFFKRENRPYIKLNNILIRKHHKNAKDLFRFYWKS